MMTTSTNKELLELEERDAFSAESRLLICSGKKEALPCRKKYCGGDGFPFTSAPESQVLGKVKDFLGTLAEANKQLELKKQNDPGANFDIEALSGNEAEIIEMDLLLGVADLQTPEAISAAEAAVAGSEPHCQYFDTDDSSSDHSSSDESNGEDDNGSKDDRRVQHSMTGVERSSSHKRSKARKPNKRPKIDVLD